jgi:hypothetical protein
MGSVLDQTIRRQGYVSGGSAPGGTQGSERSGVWWGRPSYTNPRQYDQGLPEAIGAARNAPPPGLSVKTTLLGPGLSRELILGPGGEEERKLQAEQEHAERNDPTRSEEEALGAFYQFSAGELERLRQIAERLGMDTDYTSLRRLWGELVDLASEAYVLGGQELSPWDMAERLSDDADINGDGADDADGFGIPRTSTDTRYNFTDPASAYAYIAQQVESALGRRPTEAEVKAFSAALRSYEAANPVTSVSTQTPFEGGDSESTSTVEGGANPGAFAEGWLGSELGAERDVRWAAQFGGDIINQLIGSGRV